MLSIIHKSRNGGINIIWRYVSNLLENKNSCALMGFPLGNGTEYGKGWGEDSCFSL